MFPLHLARTRTRFGGAGRDRAGRAGAAEGAAGAAAAQGPLPSAAGLGPGPEARAAPPAAPQRDTPTPSAGAVPARARWAPRSKGTGRPHRRLPGSG